MRVDGAGFHLAFSKEVGILPIVVTDVTQLLNAIESGDARAAEELLPLVYTELRKLAAAQMAHEPAQDPPGHSPGS